MRWSSLAVALAACSSSSSTPSGAARVEPPAIPKVEVKPPDPTVTRRWIAGDMHMHAGPIDSSEASPIDVDKVPEAMRTAGLDWVVLTPHMRPRNWTDAEHRRDWLAMWTGMVETAKKLSTKDLTILMGTEYTQGGYGHFGVSGVDLHQLGDDELASAAKLGGFIVVNHPFATPTNIPGIPISEHDLSFHPWTSHDAQEPPHIDGVEVLNVPLEMSTLFGRASPSAKALVAADELVHRKNQRVAIVGGSDSHSPVMVPTTWILAPDVSEGSIAWALRHGATCAGGPDAGTLEAHGDGDAAGAWSKIGDSVTATTKVELRWTGKARLFVDGKLVGELDGSYTDDHAAGLHTYRLESGLSRCGFIYANLAPT